MRAMTEPNPAADPGLPLVPGRQCGACTLCCKVLNIPALNKPENVWCGHCKQGTGCTIYQSRPEVCRDFYCSYRLSADIPEVWFPLKSKIMLRADPGGIVAFVDPGRPNAWREEPYYSHLRQWATPNAKRGHQVVVVRIGARAIAVLPDGEVDLGALATGDRVLVRANRGPTGLVYEAWKESGPKSAAGSEGTATVSV